MTPTLPEIPDMFFDQVKEALENIYDYPALQRHPFTAQLGNETANNRENPAHQMRRLLIDAIERLNPSNLEGARSGKKRIYNLLHLHYVGSMTIQEVAHELGISVRQAYRDLKKGQDSVGSVLWYKFGGKEGNTSEPEHTMDTLSSMQSEMTRIGGNIQWVNISQLSQSIITALKTLSQQNGVSIHNNIPQDARVSTNPTIARQVMMTLLSQIIQQSPSQIGLLLQETDEHIVLHIEYEKSLATSPITEVLEHLINQLSWSIEHDEQSLSLLMNRFETTVLLIDDNVGLVDLMKRYLGDHSYQVVTAHTGVEGLQLAQVSQPNVIVMDIMMPEMDGWELLQRFRTIPIMHDVPIIVCSVIDDPQLAISLGASKFVTKPIDKDKLLQALSELNL